MKTPKFVMTVRESFKLWSQRLNVLASVAIAYVLASPEVLLSTLNQLPPELRAYFPPVAGFAIFALVTIARLYRQPKLEGKPNDKPRP